MGTIIISLILLCLLVYIFFVWLWIRTVFGPKPEDGICHTNIEMEVNWNINRPPILYGPILSGLVMMHSVFYFMASILGGVLVYTKAKFIIWAILALAGFLIVRKSLMKFILALMRPSLQKHWEIQKQIEKE